MSKDRIYVKFHRWFNSQSDNGKTFAWLKEYFGSEYEDVIINIVRFVCLPIALAESGATLAEVETEVSKAKEYVDEKMIKALSSCSRRESSRLAHSNGTAPAPRENIHSVRTTSAGKNQPNTSNGASTILTPSTTAENDFLELDEDKFTED